MVTVVPWDSNNASDTVNGLLSALTIVNILMLNIFTSTSVRIKIKLVVFKNLFFILITTPILNLFSQNPIKTYTPPPPLKFIFKTEEIP
jgi:hypothetical protein